MSMVAFTRRRLLQTLGGISGVLHSTVGKTSPRGQLSKRRTTRQSATAPLKIGLLADPHYPGNYVGQAAGGPPATRDKLTEFVSHMNEWEADRVFFLGDMVHEQPTRAKSQAAIRGFREHVEEPLSMPTHPVWGNHEYGNAESWGRDWSYTPWDISADADTWYSVDTKFARFLVLNNGYSEKNHLETWFPDAEIDWLKRELQTTAKPIIVLSHLPLSIGNGEEYDHAGNEAQVAQLLSRYDNVVCCLFGHSHHDSISSYNRDTHPNPYFDQMREQRAYGMRHLYIPWIFSLQWDASYTPYGLFSVYPDGHVRLEAPYSDSGTREVFEITTTAQPPQYDEDTYLRAQTGQLRWQTHFDSVAGFGTQTTGGGQIAVHEQGVALTTGEMQGETVALTKQREFDEVASPVTGGWTNCIWRCYANLEAIQTATVELLWGDPATNYVGYRLEDGDVYGVREDGTGEVTTDVIRSVTDGDSVLFQLYYSVDLDRVDFIAGKRGTRPKRGLTPGIPTADGSGQVFYADLTNTLPTEQSINLGWIEVKKHPDLMIRQ